MGEAAGASARPEVERRDGSLDVEVTVKWECRRIQVEGVIDLRGILLHEAEISSQARE